MKTVLKIVFFLFLIMGCTKPKETCVLSNLKVDGVNVYLEQIGTFESQAEIDSYPHLAGTVVGDIRYSDRNGNGIIDSGDRCK
jgi:hypothetical protein